MYCQTGLLITKCVLIESSEQTCTYGVPIISKQPRTQPNTTFMCSYSYLVTIVVIRKGIKILIVLLLMSLFYVVQSSTNVCFVTLSNARNWTTINNVPFVQTLTKHLHVVKVTTWSNITSSFYQSRHLLQAHPSFTALSMTMSIIDGINGQIIGQEWLNMH